MNTVDRLYILATIVAWLGIYVLLFVRALLTELRSADTTLIVFVAFMLTLVAAIITAVLVAIPLRIALNVILKDRRRSHFSETVILTLVLVSFGAYVAEVIRERRNLAPPPGIQTLPEFADVMPPPRRVEVIKNDGRDYVLWIGELSGPCDFPSGPACYLFDQNGNLVDWQPETGDGGPVEEFLRSSSHRGAITLHDALQTTQNAVND